MDSVQTPLVNRVATSGLVTLDLETYYPKGEIVGFDLKNYLFMELILKEKDFREALEAMDWSAYSGKHIAVHCSTDAIIPMWAYMLVATKATPFAAGIHLCSPAEYLDNYYEEVIQKIDATQFVDKRVVVKGCSDKPVPASAYLRITHLLQPVVRSIMFGEPCSTVPVYKKSMKE